MEQIAITSQ